MNHQKHLLQISDAKLLHIVQTIPEPQVQSTHDVFFDLMSCIFEQQIHYRSTKKTFAKMLERAGMESLNPKNFGQFEQKAFKGINLSLSKFETVTRVLDFFNTHQIDWHSLSDKEVRSTLGEIKGIGNWTIDMILLYTLERPDIFPADDFHLKQIMTELYGLNPSANLKAQMLAVAETWGGERSIAVEYLLAWKAHKKSKKG